MTEASFWKIDRKYWILEVYSPELFQKVSKWKFVEKGPTYGVNHYRRQFFIPTTKARLAHKLLGISYLKNENRVRAGQQAAQNHPINRG